MTCLRTLSVHGNVLLRTVLQVPKVGTVMYQQNTTYLLSITTKGIANYSQHKILPHHFTPRYSLVVQCCLPTIKKRVLTFRNTYRLFHTAYEGDF